MSEPADRIPILRLGDCLLVTIQVEMHDRLALALLDDLANAVVAQGARGVLLDISSVQVVDSFIGRMLGDIAATCRLLDAATAVVGMRPAVAITLTELGISLPGVYTAVTAEQGMQLLASARIEGQGERPQ
jgi:rsbT antagonist protein RsbS